MSNFALSKLIERLEKHLIFESLNSIEDLRIFMQLHVFAVWDFMSLLKELQARLAPHGSPWIPNQNSQVVRLINEIVLEEESDVAEPYRNDSYASHFEIYLMAMEEIGASTTQIKSFLYEVENNGVREALNKDLAPNAAKNFLESTFDVIDKGQVHEIAASFAYGRENLVPVMFSRILHACKVGQEDAPLFHYYLERHSQLDGEEHGPMAEKLVDHLIAHDNQKKRESEFAARESVTSRIQFWDEVLLEMP